MTLAEAEQFVASLPWRSVREDRGPIDRHEYAIREWREVDADLFDRFAALIRAEGYLGRYVPPYSGRPQVNRYLALGEHVHWWIYPNQLCRTPVEHRQHEPIPEQPEQLTIEEDR